MPIDRRARAVRLAAVLTAVVLLAAAARQVQLWDRQGGSTTVVQQYMDPRPARFLAEESRRFDPICLVLGDRLGGATVYIPSAALAGSAVVKALAPSLNLQAKDYAWRVPNERLRTVFQRLKTQPVAARRMSNTAAKLDGLAELAVLFPGGNPRAAFERAYYLVHFANALLIVPESGFEKFMAP